MPRRFPARRQLIAIITASGPNQENTYAAMTQPTVNNSQSQILLCPGQGAQAVGMGKSWANKHPMAAQVFAQADKALGMEVSKLCFEGPEKELNRTDRAQVALYVTSVACYRALEEAGKIGEVVALAGLSLGEFTALHLAEAMSFEDGLRLVMLRGEAMQEAAQAADSSMVAISGDVSEEKIEALCEQARGDGVLVPANYNSPMQVVISGTQDACKRAEKAAAKLGLKATPLSVAGAFHSPMMAPAAEKLRTALAETAWSAPRVPVIANVTALPHNPDPASIQARLVEQLTSPVRWSQSMRYAIDHFEGQFVELAPGKVLSGLMRRVDKNVKVVNFAAPT